VKTTKGEKVGTLAKPVENSYVNRKRISPLSPSPVEKPVDNVENSTFSTKFPKDFPEFPSEKKRILTPDQRLRNGYATVLRKHNEKSKSPFFLQKKFVKTHSLSLCNLSAGCTP
jgi:hypothetical protein